MIGKSSGVQKNVMAVAPQAISSQILVGPCRYLAIHTMCHILISTLEILQMEMTMQELLRLVAKSYCSSPSPIFDRVLCFTKELYNLLQSQGCDLAKATDLVSATIETFEEFRSDISWNQFSHMQRK